MFKKVMTVVSGIALAMSITAVSADYAHARHGRKAAIAGGVALGVLALGAMGAYEGSYRRSGCYRGPRECRWVEGECFYDRWGDYVCRRGHRECWRPTYCD